VTFGSAAPDWLVKRAIAHRGLHAKSRGVIENSLAAALAAIEKNYAIECDVQLAGDGEAVVFHDETLDRLTGVNARLCDLTSREIAEIRFRDGDGKIPLFSDFLATVAGRVPLLVEIKSRFDGDMRLAARVAALSASYSGALALQSFDPAVLMQLRSAGTDRPLGLIAQARYDDPEWRKLSAEERLALAVLAHYGQTRPDFLAWHVADLPHAAATLWREALGRPLLTWTVRDADEGKRATRFADQIIFEGFLPSIP